MRFQRMLILTGVALLWLGTHCALTFGQASGESQAPVSLTQSEKEAGWRLLFDGQNSTPWRGLGKATFPTNAWDVNNGCLHVKPHGGSGDLVSVEKFDNFELSWEWRISFAGNSGLKYLINDEHGSIGPEYQMIDDLHAADGKRGPKHVTGSMYDVLGASNVVVKPLAEFNESRLVVRGKHVEHWLNGKIVLSYELESDAAKTAIADSKFKKNDFYGVKVPGRILLQNHGFEVWFRNLKVRELR